MRKILWFTLGLGAACAFCAYGRAPQLLILPILVLLAAVCTGQSRRYQALVAVIGMAAGLFWFSRFEQRILQPVYELDGVTKDTVIRCSSFPEETDYGYRVEGSILIGEKNYTVLCYLDHGENLKPENVLSGPFRFRVTAPGGRKESAYYQGEGIFLLAYQADELTITEEESSWVDYPARIRQGIAETLEKSLTGKAAAFAKALLIGDTSNLDYQIRTDFSLSGIRHIVAVSGLHVSVLFTMTQLLSFRKRYLSALLAFPALLLFAAVTGFSPSVSRACIMSGLMMLASLFDREYDGAISLSLAGLILLLINPLVITSSSYQLSFASVAGILLFAPGIQNWIRSCFDLKTAGKGKRAAVRWLSMSVSVTLGATVATVPLCAWYFGVVSLVSVLTNLLVLWAVSLIFYGLTVMCVLGLFWSAGASVIGKILSFLIRYVLLAAEMIADFPLSAVYTCSPYIVIWLVLVYVLLFAFLLSENRKPMIYGSCAMLGLCMALLASWAEPAMEDVRFTVLNVGQGQCLLMQTEGKTYMVDCGGSSDAAAADRAAETLFSQGISQLDGLILTHYDRDHAGGVEHLLSRIDAKLLILPPRQAPFSLPEGQVVYVREDLTVTSGDTEIRIYSGAGGMDDNESSLCILFDTEKCDILITGDRNGFGERQLLRKAAIPEVDVLVAGHHGSKYAACDELLAAVRPKIVCISAGRNNSFGHPAPELLHRLEGFGCRVYRTDLQGDIVIRR